MKRKNTTRSELLSSNTRQDLTGPPLNDSQEIHKRDCLARWIILNNPRHADLERFLTKLTKRHGSEFVEDLRNRIRDNWDETVILRRKANGLA